MFRKDAWGWSGILLGALALTLAIVQFTVGPFTPPAPLESVLVAKTLAIKHAALDIMHGKPLVENAKNSAWTLDRIWLGVCTVMAAGAIILAIVGWVRREQHRVSVAAAMLGMATIAFQPVISVFALIIFVMLLTFFLKEIVTSLTGLLG